MKNYILVMIWGTCLVVQLVLVIVFNMVSENRIVVLEYLGYALWVISMVFGWLPIFVLKKKGGVTKGKSYVHTTTLVTTGIYAVIRHPQYTAGLLLGAALALISQVWIVIVLGIIVISLLYIDTMKADRSAIEKFGSAYKEYMKKVPRTNFLLGLFRLISGYNERP